MLNKILSLTISKFQVVTRISEFPAMEWNYIELYRTIWIQILLFLSNILSHNMYSVYMIRMVYSLTVEHIARTPYISRFPYRTLYIPLPYTIHSLTVHYTFHYCTLHIPLPYTIHSITVHYTFPYRTLYIPLPYTRAQYPFRNPGRTSGRIWDRDRCSGQHTPRQIDKQIDRQINGQMDRWIDGQMDRRMDIQIDIDIKYQVTLKKQDTKTSLWGSLSVYPYVKYTASTM